MSENPTKLQAQWIAVVRHASYGDVFLTEAGKQQAARLAQKLSTLGDSLRWRMFSSTAFRAIETAVEVGRHLKKTERNFDAYVQLEVTNEDLTEVLKTLRYRAKFCDGILVVAHIDTVANTIGSIRGCFGFDPETPWPWPGDYDSLNPTQGALINMQTGEMTEIGGYTAHYSVP